MRSADALKRAVISPAFASTSKGWGWSPTATDCPGSARRATSRGARPVISWNATAVDRLETTADTFLSCHIPIQEALGISETVLKNVRYRELFAKVHEEVVRGKTLSSLLESYPRLVPPMALRLIRVGEETGTLGEMFTYLANFYEVEVDDATRNLPALLEPLLIIGIGAMVGGLALAILSPIYKIVGAV